MKIRLIGVAFMLSALSPASYAETVATGSVSFNFNTTPDSIRYNYSEDYFGGVDGVQAFFDDDYSTTLVVGDSSIYAVWDPLTGNATDYGLTAVAPPGGSSNAGVNYAIGFSVTTDILAFSYDYDFNGTRSSTDAGNILNMLVQAQISSGEDLFYSDYAPSHPSFRTNWAFFSLQGAETAIDETGTIAFEYGEADVIRTWNIGLDVSSYGTTTVSVIPVPPSLPLLLGALTLLPAVRRRQSFDADLSHTIDHTAG